MSDALKFHPIANLFPMWGQAELEALAADITEHGQNVPAWLFQGKILDGRNRSRACDMAGKKLKTREFKGTKSQAIDFVWSENFHRRHMSSSQIAMSLVSRMKIDPSFMKAVVEPLKEEAKEAQRLSKGRGKKGVEKVPHLKAKTRTKIAKLHGTNDKTVRDCQKILDEHPEHVDAILSGEKSVTQIKREIKKQEITKKVAWPKGKYRVFYADPPWSYGNTQPDYHTEQRDHYPVMTIKELCALQVKDLALDDAVLFLWVTSPILEESFEIIKAWGFKYKASFVWDKVKHNMGHYNSVRHELLLICVRGSCQPDVAKLYDSVVSEPRTEHSKKPAVFYEMIETLYPHGKRMELFARASRPGWKAYGHESS